MGKTFQFFLNKRNLKNEKNIHWGSFGMYSGWKHSDTYQNDPGLQQCCGTSRSRGSK